MQICPKYGLPMSQTGKQGMVAHFLSLNMVYTICSNQKSKTFTDIQHVISPIIIRFRNVSINSTQFFVLKAQRVLSNIQQVFSLTKTVSGSAAADYSNMSQVPPPPFVILQEQICQGSGRNESPSPSPVYPKQFSGGCLAILNYPITYSLRILRTRFH